MPPNRSGFCTAAGLAPVDRLRLQRGAEHLRTLGPRAIAEFLLEAGADLAHILDRLDEWRARLTPEMVRRAGGHHFPAESQLAAEGGR